jgi:hypothetical protein
MLLEQIVWSTTALRHKIFLQLSLAGLYNFNMIVCQNNLKVAEHDFRQSCPSITYH